MTFTTHNNNSDIDSNMTSLQGDIGITYEELVKVFGEPAEGGDKTQAEWEVEFSNGTVAVIYDWKQYETSPENVTNWHIGGFSIDAVDRVTEALASQGILV